MSRIFFGVGKGVLLGAAVLALLVGPCDAWSYAGSAYGAVRGFFIGATPREVRLDAISDRIAGSRDEIQRLRVEIARLEEMGACASERVQETEARLEMRRRRVAAGEQAASSGLAVSEALDPTALAGALAAERAALARDERILRDQVLRVEVMARRKAVFEEKVLEFTRQVRELEERLQQARELSEENLALAELARIQDGIEAQFATPECASPEVGDELAEIESELRVEQAVLHEHLRTSACAAPGDLLERAARAVDAASVVPASESF